MYSKVLLCCVFFSSVFLIVTAVAHTEDDDVRKLQNSLQEKTGIDAASLPSEKDAQEVLKKKCLKEADQAAYDRANAAKDKLQSCVMGLVDFETIKKEIEEAKPTGDMDLVFKKYCKKSPDLKRCISNFTDSIKPCLSVKEKDNTKIILNITESLTDFICYKEGDRIALFIAEGGPECLMDKQEAIENCVNSTMSKYIPKESPSLDNLPDLLIEAEQCEDMTKLQDCIVKELESCSEPTPSNIAEALFKFIRQVTPCGSANKENTPKNDRLKDGKMHNSAGSVVLNSLLLVISSYVFLY